MSDECKTAFDSYWGANTNDCQKSSFRHVQTTWRAAWAACESIKSDRKMISSMTSVVEKGPLDEWLMERFKEKPKWSWPQIKDEAKKQGYDEDFVFDGLIKLKEEEEKLWSFPEPDAEGNKVFYWKKRGDW